MNVHLCCNKSYLKTHNRDINFECPWRTLKIAISIIRRLIPKIVLYKRVFKSMTSYSLNSNIISEHEVYSTALFSFLCFRILGKRRCYYRCAIKRAIVMTTFKMLFVNDTLLTTCTKKYFFKICFKILKIYMSVARSNPQLFEIFAIL